MGESHDDERAISSLPDSFDDSYAIGTGATAANRDYVLKTVKERHIHFIRMWFTDVLGQMKSFAITPSELEAAFDEGMGFDGSSIEGFARSIESDMIAYPDASTFQVLPWRPKDDGVARMFCNIYTPEGKPFDGDPRYVLRRMLTTAAKLGYIMNVGPEVEYFYFKNADAPEPIDYASYFDLTADDTASDLRRDTILTLEQMGIPVEYSHHEVAPSQQEIDLRYSDALSLANTLFGLEVQVEGEYTEYNDEPLSLSYLVDAEMTEIDLHRLRLSALYATYQTAEPEKLFPMRIDTDLQFTCCHDIFLTFLPPA